MFPPASPSFSFFLEIYFYPHKKKLFKLLISCTHLDLKGCFSFGTKNISRTDFQSERIQTPKVLEFKFKSTIIQFVGSNSLSLPGGVPVVGTLEKVWWPEHV